MIQDWNKLFQKVYSQIDLKCWEQINSFNELDITYRNLLSEFQYQNATNAELKRGYDYFNGLFSNTKLPILIVNANLRIVEFNEQSIKTLRLKKTQIKKQGILGLLSSSSVQLFVDAANEAFQFRSETNCIVKFRHTFCESLTVQCRIIPTGGDEPYIICFFQEIMNKSLVEETMKQMAYGLTATDAEEFFKKLIFFLCSFKGIEGAVVSKREKDHRLGKHNFRIVECSPYRTLIDKTYTVPSQLEDRSPGNSSHYKPNEYCSQNAPDQHPYEHKIGMFLYDADHQTIGQVIVYSDSTINSHDIIVKVLQNLCPRASLELKRYNAEKALKGYQESLEAKIEERTAELSRQNKMLNREIEQRKKAEAKLVAAKTEAESATMAKSTFLANMSHEIRTPMNGIIGLVSLFEKDPLTPTQSERLRLVKESGKNLLRIINDILDLSKLESGNIEFDIEPVDLVQLCQDVLDSHSGTLPSKKIALNLLYDEMLPLHFSIDKGRMRQTIENLVSNAVKFTEKGSVLITLNIIKRREKELLRISITDTGIGLPASKSKNIFQRFSQADSSTTRKYGGTGLGLAIVSKMLEKMDGTIEVQSELNAGAQFEILLPISETPNPNRVSLVHNAASDLHHNERKIIWISDTSKYPKYLGISLQQSLGDRLICSSSLHGSKEISLFIEEKINRFKIQQPIFVIDSKLEELDTLNHHLLQKLPKSRFVVRPEYYSESLKNCHSIEEIFSTKKILELIKTDERKPQTKPEELISRHSPSLANVNVLLVEDNPLNSLIASDMLRFLGATVDTAEDGIYGLEKYQKTKYDVVLMDCLMPRMDGFQAIKEIISKGIKVCPIIALTANAMKGDREKCISAGFDDYLSKPAELEELRDKVLSCINPDTIEKTH